MMDAKAMRGVVLPRAVGGQAHGSGRGTMIAVSKGEKVEVAGVKAGHGHCEVIRFAARVYKVDVLQVPGHHVRQLLAVERDLLVEVDGGRVLDALELLNDGVDDLGVAVSCADRHDAREGVEVSPAPLVEQVLHLPLHNHQGILEVEKLYRVKILLP